MLLILSPAVFWVNYDRRQEENEPIVKQKQKWEEVFPAPIQELVSELEKRMEEERGYHVILLEDTQSEIEDKIDYFYNILFDIGKSIIFQYLINKNLMKRQVLWRGTHHPLKTIFLDLLEMDQSETKRKTEEVENLLQIYDGSLRKQIQEFLELSAEEQLEKWLEEFSFRLVVSQLLIELYCSLRQKANKTDHWWYNRNYKNIIINDIFR